MQATLIGRLVTLAEAADTLASSTRTVRQYIADSRLEAVRLGRKTLRSQFRRRGLGDPGQGTLPGDGSCGE